MKRTHPLVVAILVGTVLVGTMLFAATVPAAEDDGRTVRTARQSGPVTMELALTPAASRVGDTVAVVLTVRADAGVEVLMPAFGEFLGRFPIVDFHPQTTVDAQGNTTFVHRYELQPQRSGAFRVPPVLVEFVDRRDGAEPAPEGADAYELVTDPVAFDVQAIDVRAEGLGADAGGDSGAGWAGPRSALPSAGRATPWTVLGVVLAVAAIAAVVAVRLRRRHAVDTTSSPHEIATARLARLRSAPREQADEVDAFFVELSALVRAYVEATFGLHAPELTTEEFLVAARDTRTLAARDREFLATLLAEADRVKFAGYVPDRVGIDPLLDAVSAFLDRTAQAATPARSPGADDVRTADGAANPNDDAAPERARADNGVPAEASVPAELAADALHPADKPGAGGATPGAGRA